MVIPPELLDLLALLGSQMCIHEKGETHHFLETPLLTLVLFKQVRYSLSFSVQLFYQKKEILTPQRSCFPHGQQFQIP